ncbi:MAG: alpha/beta fold hydrolase [Gammaproteobacteria bacterium]|nr:alpha/beta fold hydrolase [Gammaproteobacteria bacterium]
MSSTGQQPVRRRLVVRLVWHPLKALLYSVGGAVLVLLAGGIVYLDSRADLEPWHETVLQQEFTASSGDRSFADYLAREQRLFDELERRIRQESDTGRAANLNRYVRGSVVDPGRWPVDWNRTFELPSPEPVAGVLLLHGMSDSPYSLRQLGQRLQAAGAWVVGLRLPGHGTAPSGLIEVTWQDMAAAVRLAMQHLSQQVGDAPLYIVGYSNGAALAVNYSLSALTDTGVPEVAGLALVSPAIGVTPVAALAVWQARIGYLLGLDKLAWNAILPEYDPFKYNSFAVNAGDQVHRLTGEIQRQLRNAKEAGLLGRVPPILALQSVVDATVSTPALVGGLFARLDEGGHELVLFDLNRESVIEPLLRSNPAAGVAALLSVPDRKYRLSVVSNIDSTSLDVQQRSWVPGGSAPVEVALDMRWPDDVYSLSHVALPFSPTDPLYGSRPEEGGSGIRLGTIDLRGERGVLRLSAADMLRLRSNPFYDYLEDRIVTFLGLDHSAALPLQGGAAP